MKVLMIVTNNNKLGETGKPTGFYLPEVAHPYHEFAKAGIEVVFCSPNGGHSPVDPGSVEVSKEDDICVKFWADPEIKKKLDNTLKPSDINPKDFKGVFYAGGHGPMWDVAFDKTIGEISQKVYGDQKGVLGAVCHGTCGLLPITMNPPLLKDLKVTSFTNEEEEMCFPGEAWTIMNFKLESKLQEMGANFQKGAAWSENVVNDKRVVTGQNPQSASKCAQIMGEECKKAI